MTDDDKPPYLALAIDHGATFDRWLGQWGADLAFRIPIKLGIIGASLEGRISGLVVGNDLTQMLPTIVSMAEAKNVDTWVGIPDQVVQGAFDAARNTTSAFPVCAGLWLAHLNGAVGVKAGFSLARYARWPDAMRWLETAVKLAERLGLFLVVEPYFSVQDTEAERVAFLSSLADTAVVRFSKLDVHEPKTWGPVYQRGIGSWLARSEGLEFKRFCQNVTESASFGCGGMMVGGAVWGITGRPLLGDSYVDELQRRLARLSGLLRRPASGPARSA